MQPASHGIVSLFLVFFAIATAIGAVLPDSLFVGGMYLLVVFVCALNIVFSYCAKCPCRHDSCGHYLFGKLAVILTKRKEGPYTFFDLFSTGLSIACVVLIPQLWLYHSIPALIVFWVLLAVAVADIVLFVCPDCDNKNCMMCQSKAFEK